VESTAWICPSTGALVFDELMNTAAVILGLGRVLDEHLRSAG
jgi:hypothetical protein